MYCIIPFDGYIFASSISFLNINLISMKKSIIALSILAGLLVTTTGSLYAKTTATSAVNVGTEITRSINCPSFITENSEANTVKMLLHIDSMGRIQLREINTGNPELRRYVEQELKNINLKNTTTDTQVALVIKFRVL